MNLHHRIAQILIDQATEAESPLLGILADQDLTQVCHTIFTNYRGSTVDTNKGFRLSEVGVQLMKTFFKCHDVTLSPGYKQKLPHLLYMDRIAKMPYFITEQNCVLFDSELAMMLRLVDGDLQALIDSRFRLTSAEGNLNADM